MTGKSLLISIFLIMIFVSVGVSAGFFDWFEETITGKLGEQPTDVTVDIKGVNPVQIIYVEPILPVTPIEFSTVTVQFHVHVYDPDGVGDIDDESVSAYFSKLGEQDRSTPLCPWQLDIDAYTAEFLCSIDMWYYDGAGIDWVVNVQAKDFGSGVWVYDSSTSFTYNLLKAMTIIPLTLTWAGLVPGAIDQTSDNDPTVISNTGNYDGEIFVTALNLLGETTPSEFLGADQFTVGLITGLVNPECDVLAGAVPLVHATQVVIPGSDSNPGDLSNPPDGTEDFYYCVPDVPLIPSQIYSTTGGGSWTIGY